MRTRPRRFLLENGGYALTNLGDIAMLQVGVERLLRRFPDAQLYIPTTSPQKLKEYCPRAFPVSASAMHAWLTVPAESSREGFGGWVQNTFRKAEFSLKTRFPQLALMARAARNRLSRADGAAVDLLTVPMRRGDVLISVGGGYINDHFQKIAAAILEALLIAQGMGNRTAMFGQGLGPLGNARILELAGKVFPKLDILSLREDGHSLRTAEEMGLPREKISVTGDDAISMAIELNHADTEKNCLGVNFRKAFYAGQVEGSLPLITETIKELSASLGMKTVPLPVNLAEPDSDLSVFSAYFDLDQAEMDLARGIVHPQALIQQVSRCKVVITGSYHAAVFALSLGIPVVALVDSDYYQEKFNGLSRQFGLGVTILRYASKTLAVELKVAVMDGVKRQSELEASLKASAKGQAARSQDAWKRFLDQA